MSRRFDAVLFDWDDTLCGADPHRFAYAQQVAARFGVELTMPEVYRAFVRAGDSSTVPWHLQPVSLPEALGIPDQHHAAYMEQFLERDMIKRFTLFDDVLTIIEGLGERDLRTGILSNTDDVVRLMMELDIHPHFRGDRLTADLWRRQAGARDLPADDGIARPPARTGHLRRRLLRQ